MTNDEGMTKSKTASEAEDSFWLDDKAVVVREEPETKPLYDLEERTARFGEAVIDFAKTIPHGPTTDRIISQLFGAGTSVGANYVEADDAVSKKEFLRNIGTCKKEARGDKALFANGGSGGSRTKTASRQVVDGSERTASDFCQDLAQRKKSMTKQDREMGAPRAFRHSGFGLPSSFVIGHSSFS
jgi:hypothetical protein